jgi:hypothetical protein
MEQLLIEVISEDTSTAIKEFVSRFPDASVSAQEIHDDNFYRENYDMDKSAFEHNLNVGLAQAVLGQTKPWAEVKAGLTARISKK